MPPAARDGAGEKLRAVVREAAASEPCALDERSKSERRRRRGSIEGRPKADMHGAINCSTFSSSQALLA